MKWNDDDRAKMIAFQIEEAGRCSTCGTSSWEWEEDRAAYSPVQELCMGCYFKDAAQAEEGQSLPPGTKITLVPRKKADRLASTPKAVPRR